MNILACSYTAVTKCTRRRLIELESRIVGLPRDALIAKAIVPARGEADNALEPMSTFRHRSRDSLEHPDPTRLLKMVIRRQCLEQPFALHDFETRAIYKAPVFIKAF